MLKEILSVSGKPGLFKMISQGKNMFIAESLIDKKRIPVYSREKVVSLEDIAIYTTSKDVSLSTVLAAVKEKENGMKIDIKPNIEPLELKTWFAAIVPDYDPDQVYLSDIKKLMNWYNLLLDAGITDFVEDTQNVESEIKNENDESGE